MKKVIKSKVKVISLFFLSLFFALGFNSSETKASVYNFTEEFSTASYKDSGNTNANWNTDIGRLEFPFIDDGGNGSVSNVQSLTVAKSTEKIVKATVTANINMQGAGNGKTGIVIGYKISADGGLHWDSVSTDVINGTEHSFTYPGYDLRWRAWYSTASLYQNAPPFIDRIDISYETQSVASGSLSISRVYNRNDMLRVKLEADNTDDLLVSSFTVFAQKEIDNIDGYLPISDSDIDKIELYDGSTLLSSSANINNGFVTFSNLSLLISKNSSKELIVKGTISKNSNVRRYVVYLRQKSDGLGIFLDYLAPSKMIVTGVETNVKPTINVVDDFATGEWHYIALPPTVYPYQFVEDFSTAIYRDNINTTADWNIDDKMVRLSTEGGYFTEESVVQSLKINNDKKMITKAKLTVDRDAMNISDMQNNTNEEVILGNRQASTNNPTNFGVSYSLSADGGLHWIQVAPGSEITFTNYPGYDLRWKGYIWTNINNNQNSPVLKNVTVSYNTTDVPIFFLETETIFNTINVEKGTNDVNVLEMKLTNNSSEDLIFSGAHFNGASDGVYKFKNSDISNAYLYIGETKIADGSFNDKMEITFLFDSFEIKNGESIDLILKIDIPAESTSKSLRFGWLYESEKFLLTGERTRQKPRTRGVGSSPYIILIKNNIPIKSYEDTKIYILNNGEITWIKSPEDFQAGNYNWNDVQEVSSEVLNSIPEATIDSLEIKEGAMIRVTGTDDIYIVKYIGNKKFKRLILNPSVFRSYGHLRWEDVIDTDQVVVDSFSTSSLVRSAETGRVYQLDANGDRGIRRYFSSMEILQRLGRDLDSIYEINATDEGAYDQGDDVE